MKKIILFLITITAMACSQKIDRPALVNTKWVLAEWPGRTLPVTAQATLNFDVDNKIGGKSFCNSYGGNMVMMDGSVKFEQLFSTKMFCSEFSDAENNYQADLLTINSLKMNGNKLNLLKDGQVVMVFVKSSD